MNGGGSGFAGVVALSLVLTELPASASARVIRDIVYGEGKMRVGDLYLPDGDVAKAPLVLAIHGGGWRSGERAGWSGVAQFLQTTCKAAVFNIDYRLAGQDGITWPAGGDDCTAAGRFILSPDFQQKYGLAANKIYVIGGSAGGHLALWAGLHLPAENVEGIVAISPIGDPRPDCAVHSERYDVLFGHAPSEAELDALTPPIPPAEAPAPRILTMHEIGEQTVPTASSRNFHEKCLAAGHRAERYEFATASEPGTGGHLIFKKNTTPRQLLGLLQLRIARFFDGAPPCSPSPVGAGVEMLDREMFDPERCYDKLASANPGSARCQTGWNRCETVKGVYDFGWLDRVVDSLNARGIEPWFSVSFGNPLYMTNCYTQAAVGCVPLFYGEACQTAWCNYVQALARHFRGRVTHFEIWNEPDLDHFWQPKRPAPEDYARLVKLTGGIIRQEIPGAKIGGVVSAVLNPYVLQFAALAAKDIDFFCIHCYSVRPEQAKGAQRDPNGKTWVFEGQIAALKAAFARGGNAAVEIWNGEAGFPSWFPKDHWLIRPNPEGVGSEEAQANWMLRRFLVDRRAGLARSSHFCLVDLGAKPYSMGHTTQRFPARHGLLTMDYGEKESLRTMTTYNRLLGAATYDAGIKLDLKADDVTIEQAGFRLPDERSAVAYWLAVDPLKDESRTAELPSDFGGAFLSLRNGTPLSRAGRTIPLSGEPRLLVWSGESDSTRVTCKEGEPAGTP